jgi:phage-related protein
LSKKGTLEIKAIGDASGIGKMTKEIGGHFGGLTGTVGKLAGAFAGLAVISKVTGYFVDAGKAAAEEEQQMKSLEMALRTNAGVTEEGYAEVEKWIAATQRATATADGELRPALLKVASTTKDVGVAQGIMATALDISKARGLDLNTVIVAMEKAYQGNVGGLQRLGVATKDAEGNTLSFEQVMANANQTYGGAAQEAANTTAGRMQNLSLTLADLKETVGMALLPVIEKFTGFIMDNMPTIEKVMVGFAELVGLALNVLSDTVFPILQKVFESFTGSVSDKTPGTNTLFESIGKVVETLMSVFDRVWPLIWGAVDMFIQFLTGPTGAALINGLLEGIGAVLNLVCSIFEKVWPLIQKIVQKFIDFFASPSGQKLISSLLGLVSTAVDLVLAAFEACWPVLESVVGVFLSFFNGAGGASFITGLIQTIIDIVNKVLKVFTDVFNGIGPIIGPLIKGICAVIEDIGKSAGWVIEKLQDLWYWITRTQPGVEYTSDMESGGYNPATGKFQPGSYLEHALGGVFSAPHLGLVAESGPEAIIPLNNPRRASEVMAQAGLGGTTINLGGITVNITGQGAAAGQAAADTFLQRVAAAGVRL